jgi:hypothetical protein
LIDSSCGQSCDYARDRYQTLLTRRALEEFKYTFRGAAYRDRAPASEALMLRETGLGPQPRWARIGAPAGYPGLYPEGSFFATIPLRDWTFVDHEFRPSRLLGFSPAPGAANYAAAILLIPAEFDRLVACFLEDDYAWGVKNTPAWTAHALTATRLSARGVQRLKNFLDQLLGQDDDRFLEAVWDSSHPYWMIYGPGGMRYFLTDVRRVLDATPITSSPVAP